ncbi:MAG TPA: FAD:protein FMN transferase [Candidatus Saccharimonadales bacterium]|nr:FAD:protein FMN transferase [Candidatus Saccharimonadales bacterium]
MGAWRDEFEAIGTRWIIDFDRLNSSDSTVLLAAIHKRIDAFDRNYSRFRKDSLVSQMAHRAGRYELPPNAFKMLQFFERLYRATNGLITPLIGQTLVDAGYDAEYSLRPQQPAAAPKWEDVIQYDAQSLTLSRPVLLDFGAAGKGYLVDLLVEIIRAAGVDNFTINAGGDIFRSGGPITVGLENPQNTTEAIGTIKVANQSLCASSVSRRDWGKYHHIINPETLASPRGILSTWVLADDCMTADGLATALFLVPPVALDELKFGYAVLSADMSLEQSSNFPAMVFTAV